MPIWCEPCADHVNALTIDYINDVFTLYLDGLMDEVMVYDRVLNASKIFPGCDHRWIIQPGPQTDRAIDMIKDYIARQLRTRQSVG